MAIRTYYESYWSETGFHPSGAMNPALRRLLKANLRPGSSCLDVGCGDGRTAGLWMRDHGIRYTGVDLSANAVDEARHLGLDARTIEDASELPFPEASFDAAVSLEVFEHLFQPQRCAAEIFRVLRPGGVLIVTMPNAAYWRRRVELGRFGRWNPLGDDLSVQQPWRDPHIRFFTRGALQTMLATVGFNPVTVGGHLGSLARDIPWVRRLGSSEESTRLYRAAESRLPSLLGYRLHAIAIKPDPVRDPRELGR